MKKVWMLVCCLLLFGCAKTPVPSSSIHEGSFDPAVLHTWKWEVMEYYADDNQYFIKAINPQEGAKPLEVYFLVEVIIDEDNTAHKVILAYLMEDEAEGFNLYVLNKDNKYKREEMELTEIEKDVLDDCEGFFTTVEMSRDI